MDSMVDWETITIPDRTFIIAEAGVNHNGNLNNAVKMIDTASSFGADAVKFQTFKAEKLVSPHAPKADYQLKRTDPHETQYDMLKRLELSPQDYKTLFLTCKERDILFISTPFDEESADLLDDLGMEVFKIPSGEITNLPFLSHVAKKGKPMIVSTGMASLGEVESAVEKIHAAGNEKIVLLHCVSNYPARFEDVNLRSMVTMAAAFQVPIGFSDHTLGIEISLAAVALGAQVIEKHFTLDSNMEGPDHQASLEPDVFGAMVKSIRAVEAAMGTGKKKPADSEMGTAAVARKSIVALKDIPPGTRLSEEFIGVRRPGTGLPPAMLPYLIGRTPAQHVAAGTLLTLDMIR